MFIQQWVEKQLMGLMHWARKTNQWLRWGLPGYCAFCLSPEQHPSGWCSECFHQLPWNSDGCVQCKEPLNTHHGEAKRLCGHCLTEPPAFNTITAELLYQDPIRSLVHDFKFNASPRAGMLLVELMLARPPAVAAGALLAVPMHPARARERGFNQAHWLAAQLSKRMGLPMVNALCVKHLPSQRSLNRRERVRNLAGAFQIADSLPAHVIIIDDVVTTSATAQALATVARQAGAQQVDVWAAARTPLE